MRTRAAGLVDRIAALDEDETGRLLAGDPRAVRRPAPRPGGDLPAPLRPGPPPGRPDRRAVADRPPARRRLLHPRVRRRGRRPVQPVDGARTPTSPDLDAGQLRVAVSLRQIGEGHLSSIGFATAVLGPGSRSRPSPTGPGRWSPAAGRRRPAPAGPARRRAGRGRLGQRGLRHRAGSLPERFDDADVRAGARRAAGRPAHPAPPRRAPWNSCAAPTPPATPTSFPRRRPARTSGCCGRPPPRRATAWRTPGSSASPTTTASPTYRATYTAYDGRHIAARTAQQRRPAPVPR